MKVVGCINVSQFKVAVPQIYFGFMLPIKKQSSYSRCYTSDWPVMSVGDLHVRDRIGG